MNTTDAPGNPFASGAKDKNQPAPVQQFADAPGNPFSAPPSQGMTNDQMLAQLQKYGLADEPAVKKLIADYGVSRAWDELHSKSPSTLLRDTRFQSQYNEMPWYQKLASNAGAGIMDTWHAAQGSARTILNTIGLESDRDLDRYKQRIRNQQADLYPVTMAVAREHPFSPYVERLGGQTLPQIPAMMVGGELAAGKSLLARSGLGIGEGALYGGLTPTEDQQYGRNMLLGGTLGGLAPGAGRLLGKGAEFIWGHARNLIDMFRSNAQRKMAGDIINDVTGGNIPTWDAGRYVEGFKPTLSMVTRSPKVAATENALVGKTLDDPLIAQRAANNAKATSALNSIRPEETAGSASTRAATALQAAHDAALQQKNAAWAAIDPLNRYRVPVGNAQKNIMTMMDKLSPTSRRMVPPHIGDFTNAWPLMPTQHVIDATLDLGQVAQQARAAGDARAARIAAAAKAEVDNALNSPDVRNAAGKFVSRPESMGYAQRVQDARDLSQGFYSRFGDPVITRALSRFESVPAKVDPSQALGRILSDGSPEDVARLDQALGNSSEGRHAVMSWLTNTLKDKASLASTDMEGNAMLSAHKTASLLDRNEPLLRKFATTEQYGLLQRFRNSLEANNYPSSVKSLYGNSATAPLLNTGNTLFDRASQALGGGHGGMEVGAGVGSAMGGPFGAALMAKAGGAVDKALGKALQGRVRNVYELLSQAMADPELARLLSREASAPNAPGLIQRIAARIPKRVTRAAQNVGRQQRVGAPTVWLGGSTINARPQPETNTPRAGPGSP